MSYLLRSSRAIILCLSHGLLISGLLIFVVLISSVAQAEQPMNLADVRAQALSHNRSYLSAIEDENIAQAEITRTRADALPELRFDGSYSRSFLIPKVFFGVTDSLGNTETLELSTGYDNNFRATISARQPLWHGGKVYTAYDVDKLYRKYSKAKTDQVKANVLYKADVLFHNISLSRANLETLNSEQAAANSNYDVVEKRRTQGVASDFELLQAAVKRDNLLPGIILAESDLALAIDRMKSWVGLNLTYAVTFIETKSDTSLSLLPAMADLTAQAIDLRPEIIQANYLVEISKKAIRISRGEYFPKLEAVAAYDWSAQSNAFTADENISKSWTAGLQISFPFFEGLRTKGNVSERVAQHDQAKLNLAQAQDDIRLEVQQTYDLLIQAKKMLDIQGNSIAQSEEGLKIANLRYESGIGTQLEVLAAQAALSQARTSKVQALFLFRQAKAGLQKATTIDLELEPKS